MLAITHKTIISQSKESIMRNLLRQYFGERCNDAVIVHEDGRYWVSSKSLCTITGTCCWYSSDQWLWTEMNLTQEDKRKFTVEGVNLNRPVWFISEEGFWKIVARSNNLWARRFRASFLPMQFP